MAKLKEKSQKDEAACRAKEDLMRQKRESPSPARLKKQKKKKRRRKVKKRMMEKLFPAKVFPLSVKHLNPVDPTHSF